MLLDTYNLINTKVTPDQKIQVTGIDGVNFGEDFFQLIDEHLPNEQKLKEQHDERLSLMSDYDRFMANKQGTPYMKAIFRSKKLIDQYKLVTVLAQVLIDGQTKRLKSGNILDLDKLTYVDVAKKVQKLMGNVEGSSEQNLRLRYIPKIRICVDGVTTEATDLICGNIYPSIFKNILPILNLLPNASARVLTEKLKEKGIAFSQRNIGSALKMLRTGEKLT